MEIALGILLAMILSIAVASVIILNNVDNRTYDINQILEKQYEPVKAILKGETYYCSGCNYYCLGIKRDGFGFKYCPGCGRKVKWE